MSRLEQQWGEIAKSLNVQLRETENMIGHPQTIKYVRFALIMKAFREAKAVDLKILVEEYNEYRKKMTHA